jgi:hypothetical protein
MTPTEVPAEAEIAAEGLADVLAAAIEADALAEGVHAEAAEQEAQAARPVPAVSPEAFEALAREAVSEMGGGVLLFSICVGPDEARRHVATARLDRADQDAAQDFVVLSMPAAGGDIKAEPAATSGDPVACIAAAYAGLADALAAAA